MTATPLAGFWKYAAAWRPAYACWARETRRRPRGIWFSELFAFLICCRLLRVDTVIESGLHAGQSSEAIQCWHVGQHYGIDLRPGERAPGGSMVRLCGDAFALVPPLLADRVAHGERVALLLDGPKDLAAVTLAGEALSLGAALAAVHDLYALPGEVREARRRLPTVGPCWFTDDEQFVDAYWSLDGPLDGADPAADPRVEWFDERGNGKLPYYLYQVTSSGSRLVRPMRSYGPTLGLVWREPPK